MANRVAIIERNTNLSHWRYVPTKKNPADLATRCVTISSFAASSCHAWLKGPEFLTKPEDYWPENACPLKDLPIEFTLKEKLAKVTSVSFGGNTAIDLLLEHFSSYHSLLKATAWLLRFKFYLKTKVNNSQSYFLTTSELQHAEKCLIIYTQHKSFPILVDKLKSGKTLGKKCVPSIKKLHPILVDNVIRVGGRLEKAPISWETKHPIIFPSKSPLSKLLIFRCHQRAGHSGMGHTWALLRQQFWVIKGAATVRQVIGKCVLCRKHNAKAGEQLMANLPEGRLKVNSPPFAHVGIDYFGPFLVKQRSETKRYGCIFSCLTVRAIHIEVARDLSTDAFINAMRRFIARIGNPLCIYSVNGTNFIGAERILKKSLEAWNQNQIHDHLLQKGIEWHFNPPSASHMGGSWERLIRSIRRILSATLQTQLTSDDVLTTVMAEAESILNSRPLILITLDPKDGQPLTSNHLLLLRESITLPPGLFDQRDNYARRRWAQAQYLTNQFWRRFVKEYLPSLNERQKWQKRKPNIMVNDLVLVVNEAVPRSQWSTARVLETYPDARGDVHSVMVKTLHSILKRPISKFCLIESAHAD